MDRKLEIVLMGKNMAGPAFAQVQSSMQKLEASSRSLKVALAGAVGGALALGQIVSMTKEWERLAGVQEKVEAGVKQAMVSMGIYSSTLFESVKAEAAALQKVTTFGDEAILAGTKFLMTYQNIHQDVLPRVMKAMTDLAALQGGDMKQAANQLGKASMGMTGELRRVGITVDAATFKSEGFLGVLKQIEQQVGGQARALAQTRSGGFDQLANAMSDVKEKLGNTVLQIKQNMLPTLKSWVYWLDQVADGWQKILGGSAEEMVLKHLKNQRQAMQSQLAVFQGVKGGSGFLDSSMGWIPGYITQKQAEQGIKLMTARIGLINRTIAKMVAGPRVEGIAARLRAETAPQASVIDMAQVMKTARGLSNAFQEIDDSFAAYSNTLADKALAASQLMTDDWRDTIDDSMLYTTDELLKMPDEFRKLWDQYTRMTKEATAGTQHIWGDMVDGTHHIWKNMLDGIQGSFRDNFREMLDNGLDSWQDFGDRIEDIFKDTLANIAAYYMQNAVVLPIVGRMLGGGSTQAGMLSGGGGGLGNVSNLMGFGKMIPGVQSALATPLWGGVGGSLGAAGAGGPAASAAVVGGAGPSLGAALGVAGIAAIAAPLIIGAIAGATKQRPKWNLAGAGYSGFEDNLSVSSPFGPVGFGEASRGFDAHKYVDYLNKIAESDKLIAKALKADQVEIVKNAMLSFNTGRSDEFTPEQFEEFFKVRLDYIASSIGKADSTYLEELVANFQRAVQTTATSLGSALTNGLKTGDYRDFETGLKDSIYNNVLQGMITAVTTSDIYTEMFRPVFSGIQSVLASSFAGGEFNAGTFNAGMAPLMGQLQTGISSFQPAFTALSDAMTNLQNSLSGSPTIINVNGGVWTTDDARQYFADLIAGNIQTGQGPPLMTSNVALAGVSLS